LVGGGTEAGPYRRLGVREIWRGAGGAHLGAWHFGLCKTKHHARWAVGGRTADRSVDARERDVGGGWACISEERDAAGEQCGQCSACQRRGADRSKQCVRLRGCRHVML